MQRTNSSHKNRKTIHPVGQVFLLHNYFNIFRDTLLIKLNPIEIINHYYIFDKYLFSPQMENAVSIILKG